MLGLKLISTCSSKESCCGTKSPDVTSSDKVQTALEGAFFQAVTDYCCRIGCQFVTFPGIDAVPTAVGWMAT